MLWIALCYGHAVQWQELCCIITYELRIEELVVKMAQHEFALFIYGTSVSYIYEIDMTSMSKEILASFKKERCFFFAFFLQKSKQKYEWQKI